MGTRRQDITELLSIRPATVRQLAEQLEVPLAQIVDDLEHIRRSMAKRLLITPSTCAACGFTLAKRTRFTAPSRCPRCRSERTSEPILSIEDRAIS